MKQADFSFSRGKSAANTAVLASILTMDERKSAVSKRGSDFIAHPKEKVPEVPLSRYGNIVDESIQKIGETYPAVSVDCYVIMPDHIHLLLTIHADADGRPMVAPTVDRVIQQMKGVATKRIGFPVWQKQFFDHVIRNRQDYEEHVRYIVENPMRWQEKNTT